MSQIISQAGGVSDPESIIRQLQGVVSSITGLNGGVSLLRADGKPFYPVAKAFVGTGTVHADDNTSITGSGTTIPTSTGSGTYTTLLTFAGAMRDDLLASSGITVIDVVNSQLIIPNGYEYCRITYNIAFDVNATGWRGARIKNISGGANYGNVRASAVAADATTNSFCQTPWIKIIPAGVTAYAPGQINVGDAFGIYPAQTSGVSLIAGADGASSFVQIEFR